MPAARLILASLLLCAAMWGRAQEFPGEQWRVAPPDAALESRVARAFGPDAGPVLSGVRAVLLR